MPAICASTTAFSPDRPAKRPVGAVFSCVASRNRERGPNPLGENQSLSSPPLEPRGLLLSVMRQKVGKDRSQGDSAPLAIPRQPPPGPGVPLGTRRLDFSLNNSRKLRPKTCDSQQTAICDRASRRHPARRELLGGARSSFRCRRPEKLLRPGIIRAPGEIIPDKLIVYRVDFLLRRGTQMSLGRRTGPPLPEAEDGDSANRDELCKILGPKLGRVLPMAAAATPRGRPQYAAPRDEIASSASGGREPTQPPGSAQQSLSARWRNLVKQRELFDQVPTPAIARGVSRYTMRCKPSKSPEGAVARGDFNRFCSRKTGEIPF